MTGTAPPLSALVIFADGSEEMEVTVSVDVLRRAGVQVTLAGLHGVDPVVCSRGVKLVPDQPLALADATLYDVVVLPGGLVGSEALAADARVGLVLKRHWENQRLIAAICAATIALLAHKVGLGERVTVHRSVAARLEGHYRVVDEPVVSGARLLTSRGPGTSFEFALELVRRLCGAAVAAEVRAPMAFADR